MRIPTYVVGAGGLGRGVLETVTEIATKNRNWEVKGFIDDNTDLHQKTIQGFKVLGGIDILVDVNTISNVVLCIANPNIKSDIYEQLRKNEKLLFPNIIHPNVHLTRSVKMGWGNIISENVAFSSGIEIGNFTLLHFNCSIGHDVKISDYVTIYPGSNISGHVRMRDKCEIGSNAVILPSINIDKNSTIGAGSVVTRDIPANVVAMGVPALISNSR